MEKEKTIPNVSFDEFEPTSYETWKEEAVASLKGAPFEKKLLTKTYEGITLEPIYTAADAEKFPQRLTLPGAEDFLRGTDAAGYLENPWQIAQGADSAVPAIANETLKYDLAKGTNAISIDCDALPLHDLADVNALFAGIDLAKYPLNV